MKLDFKNIYILFISLIQAIAFSSCVDDNFNIDENSGNGPNQSDEGGLRFAFNLTRGGFDGDHTSRLSDFEEEIVVNPDNFNIVLFTKEGLFLKEFRNQEISEISEYDPFYGSIKKYYVKIPTSDLSKDQNVINYIRGNNFKIAVFANWATYPDFSNKKEIDVNGIDKNNIFYITHCLKDESYISSSSSDQSGDAENLFFITGTDYKMGLYQDWLAIRFSNDQEAETAIRNNYDVNNSVFHSNSKPVLSNANRLKVTFTDMKDYDYHNVWHIWNFGGERNLGVNLCYNSSVASIRSDWAKINNDWFNILYPDPNDNNGIYITKDITCRGLTIKGAEGDKNAPYSLANGEKCVLIRKSTNRTSSVDDAFNTEGGNYIHYKVPADGYMYIKCKSETGDGTLVVRKGESGSTGKDIRIKTKRIGTELETVECNYDDETIRVTGEPADLFIYSLNDNMVIYEIDYIKSHSVQLVDRQMINPANTPEGGISMYGIQDFQALPVSKWPEGSTFDLSSNLSTNTGTGLENYKFRTISLLRSVAKVEVLLPKSIFPEPSHMYLRTFNRFSRSAPMDVFTPTDIIWDGYSESTYGDKGYDNQVKVYNYNSSYTIDLNYKDAEGVDKEIENIKTAGFTYNKNNGSLQDYQNKIAWLFGVWNKKFGWNWAGKSIQINETKPSPKIFNTRINRSDFAHMIDGGTVSLTPDGRINPDGDEYYFYYAYVPEKNVTDPNNNASMNESPKVMRIEMRFADRNTDENLDDNGAYRIYFTPKGGGGTPNRDSYDDLWEKGGEDGSTSLTNLKNIYPVMRNHLYRFKVTGLQMNKLDVEFEVKGPDSRDINYTID